MKEGKNYASYTFRFTLWLVLALIALSFLPPFEASGVRFKRADIIADIIERTEVAAPVRDAYFDTTFLAEYNERMKSERQPDPEPTGVEPVSRSQDWNLGSAASTTTDESGPEEKTRTPVEGKVVAIEDFGTDAPALDRFYATLNNRDRRRPVRIAVVGDSFIEGDIFTADLREQLQDLYGGSGVGFVPFSSLFASYKQTVSQTSSQWKTLNIMNKKDVTAEVSGRFFLSGILNLPAEGAETRLKGSTFRKHLSTASVARLVFVNEGSTTLDVTINDTLQQQFTPPHGSYVQQVVIRGEIASISVSLTDPEGFIGYGIFLEDSRGVSVDNFSLRGNSGLALLGAGLSTSTQIGKLGPYDLIVLEYGLNVLTSEVLQYGAYGRSLVQIIRHLQACFPEAGILVMSVGDRGTMQDGEVVTMPAVHGLIRAQRKAAEETGVAFWNTFLGMGGENSMARFVEKNWAAKDYTHIGYAGGRHIARELVKALRKGKEEHETVTSEIPMGNDASAGEMPVPAHPDTVRETSIR